jgi:transcriptional antiterminator NusG
LIPTEKVVSVHNNKHTVTERNLLSGYVLVEAALIGEVPHILRNTPNVLGYLENNGKPAPLRQSEVNRLLGIGDETEVLNEVVPELDFVIGESVKVADGPFSGFNGSVEEINSEKKKLKVSVKIFGRVTPLELSFTQVEKL